MQIALRAAFGQDEANHGTERYRVGDDHVVFVPPAAARYLIGNAGFYVVRSPDSEPADPVPSNPRAQLLVRVHHPAAAVCSYRGCQYRRNRDGEFLVPATAVADLIGHGFVPIAPSERLVEPCSASPLTPPAGGQSSIFPHGPSAAEGDEREDRGDGIQ